MENYMNAIVFAYYEAGLYEENGLDSKNNKDLRDHMAYEKVYF